MSKKASFQLTNRGFKFSAMINDETFFDYLYRMEKICLSIFEWVNLPKGMDSRYLELSLFFNGQCALFRDKTLGFINTKCASGGKLNLYGLPTKLNCYGYGFNTIKDLYSGINITDNNDNDAILVMNNWERIPTINTIQLFAYRLYNCDRILDVNLNSQKTPVMIVCSEDQRLTFENLMKSYDGNELFVFGDKNILTDSPIKAINTNVPFISDKILDYKTSIWNEFLTFIGVNNIAYEKKERVITDEVNQNNEVINLNLMSYLAPRQEACRQFNELYGLNGKDAISVRVRSDLKNIIKNVMSITNDYVDNYFEETIGNETNESLNNEKLINEVTK